MDNDVVTEPDDPPADPLKAYVDAHPLRPLSEDEARTFVSLVWRERHVWRAS